MKKQNALVLIGRFIIIFPVGALAAILGFVLTLPEESTISNIMLYISPYIAYALFSIFCGTRLLTFPQRKRVLMGCLLTSLNLFQTFVFTTNYLLKFTSIEKSSGWNVLFFVLLAIVCILIYRKLVSYCIDTHS